VSDNVRRYTAALEALGYAGATPAVEQAVPALPGLLELALASLLVRVAGIEARAREAEVDPDLPTDLVERARVTVDPPIAEDGSGFSRAFWELQRTEELLERLLGAEPSADPWLAAAHAAVSAAVDLLYGSGRQLTDVEAEAAGVARAMTRAYLNRAEQACERALEAIMMARLRLGPEGPDEFDDDDTEGYDAPDADQ